MNRGKLLRKAVAKTGLVHQITPEDAGWSYVGFGLYHLADGASAAEVSGQREVILVLVEGKAKIIVDGENLGVLGERMDVFGQTRPWSVYVPRDSNWQATAHGHCVLAICSAPAQNRRKMAVITPEMILPLTRGIGANQRLIHPIAMEERDIADHLLVTEVFTPPGNWSSYPPHRHDEDRDPEITYLEETYYHRLDPPTGFGFQRVFCEDGSLDEAMAVHDGDVVLVPKGHHPCAAGYGFSMYYLNVMAGPLRKWRFAVHPDYLWLVERDKEL